MTSYVDDNYYCNLNRNVVSKIHYLYILCTQIAVDPLRKKSQKHTAQSKARGPFLGQGLPPPKGNFSQEGYSKNNQSITTQNAIMLEVGLKAIMKGLRPYMCLSYMAANVTVK